MGKSRFGLLDQVESISLEAKKRMAKKCNNEKASKAGNYPSNIKDFVYDPNNDPTIVDDGEKQYAYGVLIDFRDGKKTDEDGVVTRIGNMEYHKTLPCHTHAGQVYDIVNKQVVCKLNPEDWNLPYDGKTAAEIKAAMETPTNTIEIHVDKFYCSSKVLHRNSNGNPDLFKVMFSPVKLNSNYFEVKEQAIDFRKGRLVKINNDWRPVANLATPNNASLLGGAQGYENDAISIKANNNGKVPITSISRIDMRNFAQDGRYMMNYYSYQYVLYWAFVIEYATLNSQKEVISELDVNGFHQGGLGIGMTSTDENITNWTNSDYYFNSDNVSKSRPTVRNIGVTNSIGNGSGEIIIQENGHTYHQNRYRGFEFPFGDIRLFMDGCGCFAVKEVVGIDGEDNEVKKEYIHYYLTNNPDNYVDTPSEVKERMELIGKIEPYSNSYGYDDGYLAGIVVGDKALLIPCETAGADETNYFYDYQYGAGDFTDEEETTGIIDMGGSASYDANAGLASFDAVDAASAAHYDCGFSFMRFIAD